MNKKENRSDHFQVKCIKDEGYTGALIVGHYYEAYFGRLGLLCVIDEEKEAYIYPSEYFEFPLDM